MSTRKRLLLLAFLVLFILLMFASIFLLTSHSPIKKTTFKEDSQAVTNNNEIGKPKKHDVAQLVFPDYDDIKVPEGTDKAYVSLVNPVFNQASFKFTISNEFDNETLIETGLIKPGTAVDEVPIPKGLPPGTYPLKIAIQAFQIRKKLLQDLK